MSTFPSWRNGAIKSRETAVFKDAFFKETHALQLARGHTGMKSHAKKPIFSVPTEEEKNIYR